MVTIVHLGDDETLTGRLHYGYTTVALRLHYGYTAVTLRLHYGYTHLEEGDDEALIGRVAQLALGVEQREERVYL